MFWGSAQRSDVSAEGIGAPRRPALRRFAAVRRVGALIGVVGLVLGVGACIGQEEPEPDPLETIEVDGPSEPDQEGEGDSDADGDDAEGDEPAPVEYEHPVPAPEIDDDGQAGAEAAAVYFMELFSYIHATGDLAAWRDLVTADCEYCSVATDRVVQVYRSGGYAETQPPTIHSATSQVWPSEEGDYLVDLFHSSPPLEIYSEEDAVVDSYLAGDVQSWVLLVHDANQWRVVAAESTDR